MYLRLAVSEGYKYMYVSLAVSEGYKYMCVSLALGDRGCRSPKGR